MLRLPRSWAHADKLKRVEMVLQGLGLDKCRDTIIVSAAWGRRHIVIVSWAREG